jgi:urease accessory protein
MRRHGKVWFALAGASTCWPGLAEAHAPIAGLGIFYAHLLDPFVAPSHGLLLIAAALMCGQQGRDSARRGVVAFCVAFALGLIAAQSGAIGGVREQVLLAASLVMGAAVCLDRPIGGVLTALAAAGAGVLLGLESGTAGETPRETALTLAGLATGFFYLLILIAGLTVGFKTHWHRVGVRIAGSWIVAASVLVLALSLAPAKRNKVATAPLTLQRPQC